MAQRFGRVYVEGETELLYMTVCMYSSSPEPSQDLVLAGDVVGKDGSRDAVGCGWPALLSIRAGPQVSSQGVDLV